MGARPCTYGIQNGAAGVSGIAVWCLAGNKADVRLGSEMEGLELLRVAC